jgi:hypothetical protein
VNESVAAARSDRQDELWLRFAVRIAQGREGKAEGMLFAAQRQWSAASITLAEKAASSAESAFGAAASLVEAGAGSRDVEAAFARVRERDLLAVSTAGSLARALLVLPPGSAEAARLTAAAALVPEFQEQIEEGGAYGQLVALRERAARLPDAASATRDTALAARAEAAGARATAEDLVSQWQKKAAAWSARKAEGAVVVRQADSAARMAARFAGEASALLALDTAFAVRVAGLETAGFQPAYDGAVQLRDQGNAFAAGAASAGGAPGVRQPALALTKYLEADKALTALADALAGYASRWGAEKPNVIASKELASLLASSRALQGRVDALRGEVAGLAEQARTDIGQARSLRADADRSYDKAVADKRTADGADPAKVTVSPAVYDGVVTLLDGAAGLYQQALGFQDDQAIRDRLAGIPDIQADAKERAYRLRVGEIDQQIKRAGTLIDKGDFVAAREVLDAAAAALALMGEKEPNPTLEYYLRQVNTGLGLGRQTIDQTDPLYPDIGNLMFQANEAYAEAGRRVARGTPATEAGVVALLTRAQTRLDLVQEVLPKYTDAVNLSLHLKELSEGKSAFAAAMEADVRQYRPVLKQGDPAEKRVAYEKLQDIYNFDGVKYAYLKADLDAYQKSLLSSVAAIDPAKKAEAQRLVAQAQAIYRRTDSETWDQALYLLFQAQRADPLNAQAEALAREIRLSRGAKGDLLVDSDAGHTPRTLFNRARQSYVSNDPSTAKVYLDQLFAQNPGFSNKDVDQLYAQVKGKLGI